MNLLTTLLLALGLSMDAFAVAIACGLAFEHRHHAAALRIALSFGVFQAAMPVVGWLAGIGVRGAVERWDHWIAFGLLAYLGLAMVAGAIRAHREGSALPLPDGSRLLALSLATSIDALAAGLTLAVLNVPIAGPAVVIGAVTLAMSYAGIVFGYETEHLLGKRLRRDVHVLGGLGLVALGAYILFEHLAHGR